MEKKAEQNAKRKCTIAEVVKFLDATFHPELQEDYDNAGFLLGERDAEYSGSLVALDLTPAVVDEAVAHGLNLIVTHHPFIFSGQKRITSDNELGRMIIRMVRHGIAAYAAHTNLDNLPWGVNGALTEKLGLCNCHILRKSPPLPLPGGEEGTNNLPGGEEGLNNLPGGEEGLNNLSGGEEGTNNLPGGEEGLNNLPGGEESLNNLPGGEKKKDGREEKKYAPEDVGAGMVGELPEVMEAEAFLLRVKEVLGAPILRTSSFKKNNPKYMIRKVAVCGGSGSPFIGDAIAAGADLYLTADLKYHDFQRTEGRIILVDAGHYETEQFAKEIIYHVISEKFSNFASRISERQGAIVQYV